MKNIKQDTRALSPSRDLKRAVTAGMLTALLIISCMAWPPVEARRGDRRSLPQPPAQSDAGQQSPEARLDEEALENAPEAVRLSWRQAPDADSVAVMDTETPTLVIENLTRETISLEIKAIADDGSQRSETRNVASLRLGGGEAETFSIGIGDFGIAPSRLQYSGQLFASAHVVLADGETTQQIDSPMLYFHPVEGRENAITVYGERALVERFRGGDFRLQLPREQIYPEGAVNSRVIEGGSGIVTETPIPDAEPDEIETGEGLLTRRASDRLLTNPQTGKPDADFQYTTCIKFKIKTVDSGIAISKGPNTGVTEDQHINANAGVSVIARGVRVKIDRGGWQQTFNADPTTGCFDWSHVASSGFNIRVYGFTTDSGGNTLRIHTAPQITEGTPGQTFSALLSNVTPTNGGVNTYEVGSFTSTWTAMGALAFGLFRFHDGLSDKVFHVGLDSAVCGASSAHFGNSNSSITDGVHYLKIGNCSSGGTPQSKMKFVVTHELGHAIAALYYGSHEDAVDGGEPQVDGSHNVNPNSCGTLGNSYSIQTKEWNSLTFREGFAHFVAAKIWNNKNTVGAFHWFESKTQDLRRYDFGAGVFSGGRIRNECCVGPTCSDSWSKAGTVEDWMRFFWSFYADEIFCNGVSPSKLDMLKLYRQVRLNGGLTKDNYFQKMREAVDDLNLSSCLDDASFEFYADLQGLDNP